MIFKNLRQGLKRQFKQTSKAFDQVFEEIIKDHEHPSDNNKENVHSKDFVDILLSLMHQPSEHHVIDRINIKAILLDMIAGAYDTSAIGVEWAMSELLRHPRVMKKLQELNNVVVVEESDLSKLPYLNMVASERNPKVIYPAGPFLVPRESIEDITING